MGTQEPEQITNSSTRLWLLVTGHCSLLTAYCLLFTIYCLLLTACSSTPSVIKIGLVAPFEGRNRPIGYDVIYSARLAVREINEAGGVEGTFVALVALDDGGDVELAQATAQSLVLDPAVVAVMGHWLPETTAAAAPIYATASLTLFVPEPTIDPTTLSTDFRQRYEAITPFDEIPGPYAGPAYDLIQAVLAAVAAAQAEQGTISRETVGQHLTTTD
jgi:ABC-type branched-subunit amino acid transport system substrate-binding protein